MRKYKHKTGCILFPHNTAQIILEKLVPGHVCCYFNQSFLLMIKYVSVSRIYINKPQQQGNTIRSLRSVSLFNRIICSKTYLIKEDSRPREVQHFEERYDNAPEDY